MRLAETFKDRTLQSVSFPMTGADFKHGCECDSCVWAWSKSWACIKLHL